MNSLKGLGVCVVVAGIAWAVTQVDVSNLILGATVAIIAVSLSTYTASMRRRQRDYRIAVAPRRRKRDVRERLGLVEMGARIPVDLPRDLRREEWHQPVDQGDMVPSEHETFRIENTGCITLHQRLTNPQAGGEHEQAQLRQVLPDSRPRGAAAGSQAAISSSDSAPN
ncbi:MAG: hypothetical protein QOG10_5832 [Kribbellaceae bacterium]|nr:hypothetical protein [Kribbellaceae bacterium]